MASGSITDYGYQRGLWTPTWPGEAAWTIDTSLSHSYGMDHGHQHGGLSRRPNPENEPSSISDILSWLRGGAIVHPGSVFRGRAFSSSRLLQTTLPAQLGNCTLPSFPLSLIFVHGSGTENCSVSHSICFAQILLHANTHCNESLARSKVSGF